MKVERCSVADIDQLVTLRTALWPGDKEGHRRELRARLTTGDAVVFVTRVGKGDAVGFAEAALRHDHVNGCATTPVAFLEGVYVMPEHRRHGVAASLCAAVEAWAQSIKSAELGSDAALTNSASHAFHAAVGFEESERAVFFRKVLPPTAAE